MFVLVVGGGKVGYYLAKELIESGHEVALMEKDRDRARQIADEIGSIEQDIPVHELLHLAALGEGELELIEAHLQLGSPAIGRAPKDLAIPEGCSLFAVIRDGIATPLRPDTVMLEGDKIIAIGKQECQDLLHDQLIGAPEEAAAG